ncbi:pilus assembly protein TadG-related protein [Labrys wisconsinensis]|uniref:Membrane protein n=1 Tax=Labrys wisconsinensis TaxID=425677 RepID=A0ABU0JBI3_9HYPH|nr:pilus assembly protein TadG-related protein [Labrys wisconsinensis]MDQ0471640.1 putative membrane protein [Labrys wisconsinensis]
MTHLLRRLAGPTARRFARDERGSILILSAIFMVVCIACGAVVVDLASFYLAKRQLQAGADLAAIAAIRSPSRATAAVSQTVASNGLPTTTTSTLVWGTYDSTQPIAQRFSPLSSNAGANAAQITLQRDVPMIFGRAYSPSGSVHLTAIGVAALSNEATISIGSRLLSLNGGVLNSMLSSLTGSSISLQLVDYNSLASANIDLLKTLSALGSNINLTAGTYNQILNSNVTVGQLANAIVTANPGLSLAAQLALSTLGYQAGTTAKVTLAQTINLGSIGNAAIGGASNVISVGVLNLIQESLLASNGQNQLAFNLGATIPGLLNTTVTMTVGERPQWLSTGPVGTMVRTAQIRLLVKATVGGTAGALLGLQIQVPVYIEVATAQATIASMTCDVTQANGGATVTVAAQSGVAKAWIANIPASQMTNFTSDPAATPANLVTVSLLSGAVALNIGAYAYVVVGSPANKNVTFTSADITAGTIQTITSTGLIGSLVTSLLGNLQLTPSLTVLGLDPLGLLAAAAQLLVQPILQTLTQTLATLISPVDGLVSNVLQTLGLGLGQADLQLLAANCGQARLVM